MTQPQPPDPQPAAAPSPILGRPGVPAQGYAVPPGGAWQPGQSSPYGLGAPAMPTTPQGRPLAEFWERLVAYVIDRAILSLLVTVPTMVLAFAVIWPYLRQISRAAAVGADPAWPAGFWRAYLVVVGVSVGLSTLVTFLYDVVYQYRSGQTLGKRVMRVQVVRLDGQALVLGTMTRRWLVVIAGSLVPGLSLLDGLWQLWDQPYRQCLHDKFAQTAVVKVER